MENRKGEVPFDKNVEGQITISPDVNFYEIVGDKSVSQSRVSVVLHELVESYERTTNKLSYAPENGKAGAHDKAVEVEKSLPEGDKRKSKNPGTELYGVELRKGEFLEKQK